MKTKLEIIEETAKAYTISNRAADSNGVCRYYMEDGDNALMCAVGRCMLDPANMVGRATPVAWLPRPVDTYLKPEYRGHEPEFWRSLQDLHDEPSNWDEEGLSAMGQEVVARLKKTWGGK